MCVAVGWIVTVRARCLIACTWMARVGAALGWEGGSSTGREKFRRRRNFCDRGEGRGQGGPKGDHPGCFMMSRQCQKHHTVARGCSAQAFGPGVFGPIGPSDTFAATCRGTNSARSKLDPYSSLFWTLARFCLQFICTPISVRVELIFFVALFISFPLVPHVLGVQIDLLDHLTSQSLLITFTLVLSKGSVAPQANERTLERVLGARIRF